MTKKANNVEPKKPLGQKVGSGATKATMGLTFGLGRFAYRAGKNFAAGAREAAAEIRRGYEEAAAEEEKPR